MLLQNWDGDVRDLHAPRPWYRVRITHKKSKLSRIVELQEGMEFPIRGKIDNYSIQNLGIVNGNVAECKAPLC